MTTSRGLAITASVLGAALFGCGSSPPKATPAPAPPVASPAAPASDAAKAPPPAAETPVVNPWEAAGIPEAKREACPCPDLDCVHATFTKLRIGAVPDEHRREVALCTAPPLRPLTFEEIDSWWFRESGLATLVKIHEHACSCQDMACIEAVQKELEVVAKMNTKDIDTAKAVAGGVASCMRKILESTSASPPSKE